jgi:CRP-like cAMP-binding protein
MDNVHQTLVNKLKEHSKLTADDVTGIETINYAVRHLGPNEDLIRQGDTTKVSALVLHGMLARYHLMPNGRRQSFISSEGRRPGRSNVVHRKDGSRVVRDGPCGAHASRAVHGLNRNGRPRRGAGTSFRKGRLSLWVKSR